MVAIDAVMHTQFDSMQEKERERTPSQGGEQSTPENDIDARDQPTEVSPYAAGMMTIALLLHVMIESLALGIMKEKSSL